MKQLNHIFLGIGLLLSSTLLAQTSVDYPLDTINGKIYYRYTVERGIGLYRISKNFGVSQEDILKSLRNLAGPLFDSLEKMPPSLIFVGEDVYVPPAKSKSTVSLLSPR